MEQLERQVINTKTFVIVCPLLSMEENMLPAFLSICKWPNFILQMQEACMLIVAVHIFFQDPLRTFVGREKYKRPLWITKALEKPVVVRIDQIAIASSTQIIDH
jgi:hypothetical protein